LEEQDVNRRIALIALLFVTAISAWAQMGTPPGPEVKKLDYFLGAWTTEGTIAQGPWGMGGKFTSSATTDWMPGNFFLQSQADVKMPPEVGGDYKALLIMGYDTQQNVYASDRFSSLGRHETSTGTLSGDTWTWSSTSNYGGTEIQGKMTIKTLSPTSYTLKYEISLDGKNWMPFMDGKATKK
jgi:hypothetical protein